MFNLKEYHKDFFSRIGSQTTIPSLNYVFKVKYNPNDQIVEGETIEKGKSYVKKYTYTPEGYKIAEIGENGNKTCIESEFKGRPNKILLPQALDEKGQIITPILHQTFDAIGIFYKNRFVMEGIGSFDNLAIGSAFFDQITHGI